jgi:hypothetical protein
MKSRENMLRLKHFQVEDRTRQLTQIELMIGELARMADELGQQIRIEETRTGIADPAHFAYPTFAKAARQRRANLEGSIRDLSAKRQAATEALAAADEDLKKAMLIDQRDGNAPVSEAAIEARTEARAMIG